MQAFLVEKRPHPLLRDAEQWIYCFPDAHPVGRRGCLGLSVIIREDGPCEGAVLAGMSKDGYGGEVAHEGRLLPGNTRRWSQPLKDKAAAQAWIRRAIHIYG